jgi:hypothetical protein
MPWGKVNRKELKPIPPEWMEGLEKDREVTRKWE